MEVVLIREVRPDYNNNYYDYKVFKVNENKKFAWIYEHNNVFYNLLNRRPFISVESAAKDIF